MDPKITVLIANAFPLVRNSMKDLLDSAPNLEVAGCAKTRDEVFALVEAHRPRVSILDLEVEFNALTDMVAKLAGRDTHALVMTDELDEDKTFQLLRAGANGIVSRRVDPELLCRSVRAVAGGEIWVPRTATSQLIQRFRMNPGELVLPSQETRQAAAPVQPQAPVRDYGLTRREWDIVRAIGDAMSNKDIAVQLGISEYTVKHHLTKIFDKVGVYSRLELAMMATHHGLVNNNVGAGVTV